MIIIPNVEKPKAKEQAVNRLIMLKTFLNGIPPIFAALSGLSSDLLAALRHVSDQNHKLGIDMDQGL
jgi:hypothetical protein